MSYTVFPSELTHTNPRRPVFLSCPFHKLELHEIGELPATRMLGWARWPRSQRLCAEVRAYKFLESRVLSSFVFLDTTRSPLGGLDRRSVETQLQQHAWIFALDQVVVCMVTTRPPKTIVEPTALGTVANTDSKLLIYRLFQKAEFWHRTGN